MLKTVILDVDGTLLDWKNTFIFWMVSRGYVENNYSNSMNMKDYFYDVDDIDQHILKFNSSIWMGMLPMLPNADVIKKFKNNSNIRLNICTSFSQDPSSISLRKQNLINVFGDIFDDYIFCNHVTNNYVEDKINYIKSLDVDIENLFLFEDNYYMVEKAIELQLIYPFNIFIIKHKYNEEECFRLNEDYGVNIIDDWKHFDISKITQD